MRTSYFLIASFWAGLFLLFSLMRVASAADVVRFQCHLKDVDTKTENMELIDFTRDVPTCKSDGSGACFIPIDHLKTKNGCRDFVASYDEMSEPATLDVTLWPYCGANTDPNNARSQTVSIPTDSKHFQLTAEWGTSFLALKCDRT